MALQAQMFHDRWHRTGWTRIGLGVLFLVLVGLAVGLGVWALVRGTRQSHSVAASGYPLAPPTDPALDMLRMRFARGEIDAAEYASRVAHLSGAVPPPAQPSPPPPPPAPPNA